MDDLTWVPEQARCWNDREGRPTAIVEVTIRMNRGQMALTPTDRNNALIMGVIGRAKALYGFEFYMIATLTNHLHYLIGVRSAKQLAAIKEHVHGNIAREIGWHGFHGPQRDRRGLKLRGRFWARRGRGINVTTTAKAIERFRYLLANGTADGLVRHPRQMPGAHGAKSLCRGDRVMAGVWYDRTRLDALRARFGRDVPESAVATHYAIKLDKLPPLRHLSDEAYTGFCRDMCDEIAADAREKFGPRFRPMGPRKMRRVHPLALQPLERRLAPRVHCDEPEERRAYIEDYKVFVAEYQLAHHRLKAALQAGLPIIVEFPPGGIPPTARLAE